MPTFEEFVQLELPKRPFVETDGLPGQILKRSNNPHAPRELVWVDDIDSSLVYEFIAGINITKTKVISLDPSTGNAIYATNSDFNHISKIVGISLNDAKIGETVKVIRNGKIIDPSLNLVVGLPVFLGVDGNLTQEVPFKPLSEFIIHIGVAISSTSILISLTTPLLLA